MKGVFWKTTFRQLAMVVTVDKELDVFCQGLHSASEAPRLASQTFQVVAKVSIHRLNGISFLFIRAHFVGCAIVECVVGRKGIGVVLFGLWSSFQAGLQSFRSSLTHHIPTQHTAGLAIHNGYDVD